MTNTSTKLLKNKFIQSIMISGILLQIGIWVRNFAILLFVMEKTNNNPYAVSLISIAEFTPILLFSFIGGTFADRWRPKRTMVTCDLLSAVSVFVVLLAIIFDSWKSVFFVTFVSAILSQFSQPSAMKLFKSNLHPDDIQLGMTLFQTMMAIFMIIGPGLGTFVYHHMGINVSIAVMGVAFFLSAAALSRIPPDPKESTVAQSHFIRELIDGFHYVWKSKVLRIMGGVFLSAGLGVGLLQTLNVFIVIERLGLPKENVQWLFMANGAAMLIGGAVLMKYSNKISPQNLLAIGMTVNGFAMLGSGLSTVLPLTLCTEFLAGFFMPCIQIGINTLILQKSEEAFVGRVNGVLNPLFMAGMVLTMCLAGWLKSIFAIAPLICSAGVLFFIGALMLIPILGPKHELI